MDSYFNKNKWIQYNLSIEGQRDYSEVIIYEIKFITK